MTDIILVHLWKPVGHADDEISISWKPVNFMIDSGCYFDLVSEAIDEWVDSNSIHEEECVELMFVREITHDGAGAVVEDIFSELKVGDRS